MIVFIVGASFFKHADTIYEQYASNKRKPFEMVHSVWVSTRTVSSCMNGGNATERERERKCPTKRQIFFVPLLNGTSKIILRFYTHALNVRAHPAFIPSLMLMNI